MENQEYNEKNSQFDDLNEELSNEELLNANKSFWTRLKQSGIKTKIINVFLDISFCVLLFVLATNSGFATFYENSEIVGASMKPTFNAEVVVRDDPRNEMAVYKKYKDYTYGDVIISNHGGTMVIKRIIAMEGDRIKVDKINGVYYILLNGEILDEPYIDSKYATNEQNKLRFESLYNDDKFGCRKYFDNQGYLVVPEGYYFYIGDNRTNSSDCLEYGPQPIKDIQGKVVYKYPSSYVDDKLKFFGIKVIVLFGNLFNGLQPNF